MGVNNLIHFLRQGGIKMTNVDSLNKLGIYDLFIDLAMIVVPLLQRSRSVDEFIVFLSDAFDATLNGDFVQLLQRANSVQMYLDMLKPRMKSETCNTRNLRTLRQRQEQHQRHLSQQQELQQQQQKHLCSNSNSNNSSDEDDHCGNNGLLKNSNNNCNDKILSTKENSGNLWYMDNMDTIDNGTNIGTTSITDEETTVRRECYRNDTTGASILSNSVANVTSSVLSSSEEEEETSSMLTIEHGDADVVPLSIMNNFTNKNHTGCGNSANSNNNYSIVTLRDVRSIIPSVIHSSLCKFDRRLANRCLIETALVGEGEIKCIRGALNVHSTPVPLITKSSVIVKPVSEFTAENSDSSVLTENVASVTRMVQPAISSSFSTTKAVASTTMVTAISPLSTPQSLSSSLSPPVSASTFASSSVPVSSLSSLSSSSSLSTTVILSNDNDVILMMLQHNKCVTANASITLFYRVVLMDKMENSNKSGGDSGSSGGKCRKRCGQNGHLKQNFVTRAYRLRIQRVFFERDSLFLRIPVNQRWRFILWLISLCGTDFVTPIRPISPAKRVSLFRQCILHTIDNCHSLPPFVNRVSVLQELYRVINILQEVDRMEQPAQQLSLSPSSPLSSKNENHILSSQSSLSSAISTSRFVGVTTDKSNTVVNENTNGRKNKITNGTLNSASSTISTIATSSTITVNKYDSNGNLSHVAIGSNGTEDDSITSSSASTSSSSGVDVSARIGHNNGRRRFDGNDSSNRGKNFAASLSFAAGGKCRTMSSLSSSQSSHRDSLSSSSSIVVSTSSSVPFALSSSHLSTSSLPSSSVSLVSSSFQEDTILPALSVLPSFAMQLSSSREDSIPLSNVGRKKYMVVATWIFRLYWNLLYIMDLPVNFFKEPKFITDTKVSVNCYVPQEYVSTFALASSLYSVAGGKLLYSVIDTLP